MKETTINGSDYVDLHAMERLCHRCDQKIDDPDAHDQYGNCLCPDCGVRLKFGGRYTTYCPNCSDAADYANTWIWGED